MDERPIEQPFWLVTCLASAFSIVAYRLAAGVNDLAFCLLRRVSSEFVLRLTERQETIRILVGVPIAILTAVWFCRHMRDKSIFASKGALACLVVVAALPITLSVRSSPIRSIESGRDVVTPTNVAPVELHCRLIDGVSVESEVVLANSDILKAEPWPTDEATYQIRLFLTREGQDKMRKVTSRNVGKRLGFWIDDDMEASPKIMEALIQEFICMPVRLNAEDAARLALGITASNVKVQ